MVAIFPNVCLWRRSYSQNWEVLTFICQYGLRYCIVSPSFLFYCFVKIWATWENFLGKELNAPPGKKLPVRLWKRWLRRQRVFTYPALKFVVETFLFPPVFSSRPIKSLIVTALFAIVLVAIRIGRILREREDSHHTPRS